MSKLDPVAIFKRLREDLPAKLVEKICVTGSLAAAYAFRVRLASEAVNTKDADLLVHPAGQVEEARQMALWLLTNGWTRVAGKCYAMRSPMPAESLRLIRLHPPKSDQYFIEFLTVPEVEQSAAEAFIPVELDDGWYGLKSFRFMGLTAQNPRQSAEGLAYACPEMMALSNLLSHPRLTGMRMESGQFEGKLRCAKDLGRVVALAHLTYVSKSNEIDNWPERWRDAMRICFPATWSEHGMQVGNGLRELLDSQDAITEAQMMAEAGLLSQMNMTAERLRAVGGRFLVDVIDPFEALAKTK